MNKFIKYFPLFLSVFYYSQQNYFIVAVDKQDKNYPNEHSLYFWIIDLSAKNAKPAPLYLWKVSDEEKNYCTKYNNIYISLVKILKLQELIKLKTR